MHQEDPTLTVVRRCIAEAISRSAEEVAPEASLDGEGLGVDSLALIRVQVALEETFDVALPALLDGDPSRPRTVAALASLVASLVDAERAA